MERTAAGVSFTRMTCTRATGADTGLGKVALSTRYPPSKHTVPYGGASPATGDLKDFISQK